jgi:hypothetical protein
VVFQYYPVSAVNYVSVCIHNKWNTFYSFLI